MHGDITLHFRSIEHIHIMYEEFYISGFWPQPGIGLVNICSQSDIRDISVLVCFNGNLRYTPINVGWRAVGLGFRDHHDLWQERLPAFKSILTVQYIL